MIIQEMRNIFPNLRVARYNLTAWQKSQSNSIYFIGREVRQLSEAGEPDTGILKLFEFNQAGKIVQQRVIWKPMFNGINLEDPRALELPNENLLIGLTAVLRDKQGKPVPYPAIIKIDSHSSWSQELPPFLLIGTFGPGKNITPLDNITYLFRPNSREYHHKILVFTLHRQVPEKLADIEFPTHLSWARWRIGTTMPPIWLNDTEALFIIHGITIKSVKGVKKYVYSIGKAKLTRHGHKFTVKVAKDPILTPENFVAHDGAPLVPELHPELRRVVYSCGGIIKKDTLALYVNVGDRTTFEVELLLSELKSGLFD